MFIRSIHLTKNTTLLLVIEKILKQFIHLIVTLDNLGLHLNKTLGHRNNNLVNPVLAFTVRSFFIKNIGLSSEVIAIIDVELDLLLTLSKIRCFDVLGLTNQLADFVQLLTKIIVEQLTVQNSVGIVLEEGLKSILNVRNTHVLLTLSGEKTVLGSNATVAVELTLHTPRFLGEVRLLAQLMEGLSKHRFNIRRNVYVLDILVIPCLELFLVLGLNLGRCLLD